MKQMRHIRTGIHSVLMFHVGASDIKLAPTFFAKVRARSRRCSSFPNRTLCAGLRFGFGHESESFIMYSAWIFHVAAKCTLRPRLFIPTAKKENPVTVMVTGFLAEMERFELSRSFCPLHDFQSCALDQLRDIST